MSNPTGFFQNQTTATTGTYQEVGAGVSSGFRFMTAGVFDGAVVRLYVQDIYGADALYAEHTDTEVTFIRLRSKDKIKVTLETAGALTSVNASLTQV